MLLKNEKQWSGVIAGIPCIVHTLFLFAVKKYNEVIVSESLFCENDFFFVLLYYNYYVQSNTQHLQPFTVLYFKR